jgi:UDP-GlcNAc:undecaprenyl-phosphate GlcNAc-1-phosphate transferase
VDEPVAVEVASAAALATGATAEVTVETPAMAELSAEDKALLGRLGSGASAVGGRTDRQS